MKRIDVVSGHIRAIGYEDRILEIEFINGDIYQYRPVPLEIYTDFMSAEPHFEFFRKHIIDKYIEKNVKFKSMSRYR